MTDTKLTSSKKFRMVIISGIIITICQAVKVYYPEFPSDQVSDYVMKLFLGWLGGHVSIDLAHSIRSKT